MKPRAILFDLFDTVVRFRAHVPAVQVGNTRWRSTMPWLEPLVRQLVPQLSLDDLLRALVATTEEIIRERPPEYLEVPSRVRFERALSRLGVDAGVVADTARELSLAHMGHLAAMTFLPEGHLELLHELGAQHRLGLVSNFDHAPTARRILKDCGVSELFEVILISDEFGRRKPHRAIFEAALASLQVLPQQALFVGDNLTDDVGGARNAGIPVAWISDDGVEIPPGMAVPDHTIDQLTQLRELIDR